MKSEINLLNFETKSLHTPKELEQENLKNYDLNALNGAEAYNYIETERMAIICFIPRIQKVTYITQFRLIILIQSTVQLRKMI